MNAAVYIRTKRRRAVVAIFTIAMMMVLLGFGALTIDVGLLYNTRADLQDAADAAALAAAKDLGGLDAYVSVAAARATAEKFIQLNLVWDSQSLVFDAAKDVVFGQARLTNAGDAVAFTPNAFPPNAVEVSVHYDLDYTLGGVFGLHGRRVSARAVSAIGARDFMIVIDASGSMTKQSVEADVAADLTALGIPFGSGGTSKGKGKEGEEEGKKKGKKKSKKGAAIQTALSLTYNGSIPGFVGVFAIGDPFLPPSVRILPLKSAKDAAVFGVNAIENAGYDDQIGVASFAPGAPWAQELTTDYNRVRAKLGGLTKYGGSDIHVGILAAMTELQSMRGRAGADKAMVVFADGQSDGPAALAAAQVAADAGITIHCVGLGANVDQVLLDGIATIGGGVALYVLNNTDVAVYGPELAKAFQSIAGNQVGIGLVQ